MASTTDDQQRTAILKGDTAWVPGHSNTLPVTFTAGNLTWGTSDEHGSHTFSFSEPKCTQGSTRVTMAVFTESAAGNGGGGSAKGLFTRK
ncbi:hypothetical protein [Nocardia mangyaensis]|uniref:hypothetical protein n=1 Tax=Nocardia mangyaensis TaxID=2213200 RepID=UPI002674BD7D|nr:hypothetical protein [Nocardia mangyaensis]MDO3649704.1 hypothetical protein [Nocardia mangyaensis]